MVFSRCSSENHSFFPRIWLNSCAPITKDIAYFSWGPELKTVGAILYKKLSTSAILCIPKLASVRVLCNRGLMTTL